MMCEMIKLALNLIVKQLKKIITRLWQNVVFVTYIVCIAGNVKIISLSSLNSTKISKLKDMYDSHVKKIVI